MFRTAAQATLLMANALILVLGTSVVLADQLIDFDNLPAPPAVDGFRVIANANGGSTVIDDITFDSRFVVVGNQYVEQFFNQGGTNPFAIPRSDDYAVFNINADDGLAINTDKTLVGLWLGRPDMGVGPRGTDEVLVRAMNGNTIAGTVVANLASSTPQFVDTSEFLGLSGLTGYRLDRVAIGGDSYGGGHYILDDLQFVTIPEPSALVLGVVAVAGLFGWRRV